MFTNRTPDGRNNIVGVKIAQIRKNLRISQRELADRLQINGLDIDKNAVQRMESGQRFITDRNARRVALRHTCQREADGVQA